MTKSKIPLKELVSLTLYVCLCLISACKRTNDPSASGSQTFQAAPSPTASQARTDAAFVLRYDTQDAYAAKTWQLFDVVLDAKGHWHLNKEFPTELTVLNPPAAVKFQKTTLGPADALIFSEPKFHFRVPFMADPGDHPLKVKLNFAVCTPQTCVPEERIVELSLHVTN